MSKMGRILRSFLQEIFIMVNTMGVFVGTAFILYGLWMMSVEFHSNPTTSVREFHSSEFHSDPTALCEFHSNPTTLREFHSDPTALCEFPSNPTLVRRELVWHREFHSDPTLPWFIYTSFGLGVSLCLITCFGYIAAETANGRCISFYMILIFLLVMLEAAITALVILNKDWEEVFPYDTTGRFNQFKNFIRSDVEFFKWVGLIIVTAQGMSIFLAMILKALGPHSGSSYGSDDHSVNARLLLLTNQAQQGAIYVCDAHLPYKSGSWNVRYKFTWSSVNYQGSKFSTANKNTNIAYTCIKLLRDLDMLIHDLA